MRKTATIFMTLSLILVINMVNFTYTMSDNKANELIDMYKINEMYFGNNDDLFEPDEAITKAEIVTLINHLLNLEEIGDSYFDDLKGDEWFFYQARIAKNYSYVDTKTFNGNSEVTLCQTIDMLSNILSVDTKTDILREFGLINSSEQLHQPITKGKAILVLDTALGYVIDEQSDINVLPENIKNICIVSPNIALKDLTISNNLIIAPNAIKNTIIKNCIVTNKLLINKPTYKKLLEENDEFLIVENTLIPLSTANITDLQITYYLKELGFGETFLATVGIPKTVNKELEKARASNSPNIMYSSLHRSHIIKIVFDTALYSQKIDDTSGFLLMDGDKNEKLDIIKGRIKSNFVYLETKVDLSKPKTLYLSYSNYFNNYRLVDTSNPKNIVEDFEDLIINFK